MNKRISLMLSILGIISIILITVGITYAFFNYAKEGTTENVMSSGTLTFIYEEVDKQGAGILIENAYPMLDGNGKILSGTKEVFNFKVKSTTGNNFTIPYIITARKDNSSTLDEDAVRIYLTEVDGETEREIVLDNYNKLEPTDMVSSPIIERIIHTDIVPKGSTNYEKEYRLRMWIDSDIDFSPDENDNYEYNNKTFKITVNVYADAEVVTAPTKPTAYYEFGLPTTASSTSFLDVITESGSKSFVKLEDEQLSVCIYRNETLECFKNNNFEEESTHLVNVFGENSCSVAGSNVNCDVGVFRCYVDSDGNVSCSDNAAGHYCDVYFDGRVYCR